MNIHKNARLTRHGRERIVRLARTVVSLRCRPPFADRQVEGRFCFKAAAVMRSVHKFSYGHKFERAATTPVVA